MDLVTTPSRLGGPSLRSQILGTWDLVSYIGINIENPEDVIYPMGKDSKGQIVYSNDGYMAALLQWGDIKPFEQGWNKGTTEEWAIAAKKTMAYAGPYYLDEKPGKPQTIVHHAQLSMHPNLIETLQVRCAEFITEGGRDYLMLGPACPYRVGGAACELSDSSGRSAPRTTPPNLHLAPKSRSSDPRR